MKCFFYLLVLVSVNSEYVGIPENITSPCIDKNHIFLAPGVLTAGGSSRACISRFYAEGPARLTITLLTEDREAVTASRELPPGDGGCIDISVPQLPNTKADMIVSLRYPDAQCTWERRASLRVSSARVVAVHMERARYRPGETLRGRLFVLKADLTPAHGIIDEIWLEGPRGAWPGARAAQWARVRTRLGVAQITHELDAHAPPGKWTLRAALGDGSQGSAVFWVGNYELPPFQLSVRHAPRVLRTSERLVWTVCVRYPWTEAVQGMLYMFFRIRGAGTLTSDGTNGIRTAASLKAPRACHRHAAAARRIGLKSRNPSDVVLADFSFQEEGTRIWQNTTVVSQVVDKEVTLEFLTKHRAVISPGLPYKLKVKAIRWDEKPAPNELIRVCRSPASHESELQRPTSETSTLTHGACDDAITDVTGVARVMFSANDDGSAFYRFQATLQNDTSTTTAPLYLPVQRSGLIHAALGPLKPELLAVRTFVPLYLNMRNISRAITVHFAVITRGGIIYRWGATTQCPFRNPANQIQVTSRNSLCNANLARLDSNSGKLDVNASDALMDRHLLRVMLPIKITHQMCPDSHMIAYFYYMGELVSASKHFEMEECFGNKVEAIWQSRQTPPGSSIDLHLTTPGPALCALTALDSASKWVQPGQSVKDILLERLRRLIDGHRNLTEYDAAGECFLTADTPDPPTTSMELTATWMAAAGVRILGGEAIRNRRCQSSAPATLLADDVTVPRSDFSEAWLWRLVAIGANGSMVTSARAPDSITRYEASAVCVSRTGLAISQPAVLQVFREFFVKADSPKRLRRGDTTIIIYRLFNYLYEPLSVQIQILADPHLEGPSDNVDTACVSPRSSTARRIEVRATLPGNARISIRAKSVKDGRCVNATHSRSEVSDEVIIQITVDPEGVPVQEQKSILLCGRGSTESSISGVSWNWPDVQAVPGTEALTVWAIGDIAGPLLADADDLVMLPRGCGEQNMARLATNLLALKQLDPRSTAANAAKEHVARGFTRQLQYMHPSGGFSAFGSSDAAPSTWLTAFAVRYLRRAHEILTPGLPAPPALEQAEHWLINQQMENGCFRNEGQVFHRELRGGLNEDGEIASVALTAYVITSLIESSIPLPSRILRNTLSCLRALPPLKTRNPARVYAHSLLAYAFMRLRNYEEELKRVNEASLLDRRGEWKDVGGLEQDEEMRELVELLKMARRTGEYVWWETGSLSTSIEATGYALLALSRCPPTLRNSSCAHDALGAVRWLSTHRNPAGGFVATQDTLVALEALISWSSVQPSSPTRLVVTAQSRDTKRAVNIQPGERIPDVMKMGNATKLSVNVEGIGCALIQATRSYNVHSSDDSRDKLLSVQVTVHTDGTFNCGVNDTSCFCAAVVEACVVWTGAFPEMALLEVALPGGFGADASLLYSQLQQNSTLVRHIELTPNSGRATLYLGTRDGSDTLDRGGHECYNLHAVGPRTKTKAAYAKVMDYYRPMVNDTQLYTIPEDCPPRISHKLSQYSASENLFNKAKSLSDSKEIIITHEFSFEDIPDGIPLEDPLYDNLKDDKEANLYEINKTEAETDITNNKNDIKYIILPLIPVKLDDKLAKINDDTTQTDVMNSRTEQSDAADNDFSRTQEQTVNTDRKESNLSDLVNVKDNITIKDKIIKSNSFNQERKEPNSSDSTINLTVNEPTTNKMNANTSVREGKSYFNYLNNDNEEVIDKTTTDFQNETPTTHVQKEQLTETRNKIQEPVQATTHLSNQEEKPNNVIKDVKDVNAQDMEVDNPNLAHFHVIDSDKDLEVPAGVEGPVPSVVLPPPEMTRRNYFDEPNTGISYGVPLNRMPYQNPRTFDRRPGVYFYYNQPLDNFYLWNNMRRYGR